MKINRQQYKNIWFTSDFHYLHDRPFIIGYRNFPTISDHDAFLLNTCNSIVDEDDIIFFIGDLCFGGTEECAKLLEDIKCKTIYFINGNHDKDLRKVLKTLKPRKGITRQLLGEYQELRIKDNDEDQDIILCHYPMLSWNKSHHGSWNICGHSHGSNPESLPDHKIGKRLDVSVDVGLKFNSTFMFTYEDVKRIMASKITTEHH